jgi:hypothetical protein
MQKKTKWIVLIDFSDYSEVLIKFTERMCNLLELDIVFIHQVYGMAPALTDFETKLEIIEAEKLNALNKLKSITSNTLFKNAKYIVSNKNLMSLINEQTHKNGINVVITGLKGTGVLKQLFIGSTTTQIVNELDTLTIAIPLQKEIFIPEKLIIAAHYKYPVNKLALEQVLSIFNAKISVLEFITVITNEDNINESKKYLSGLSEYFSSFKVETIIYQGDNVFDEIKNHMSDNKHSFLITQQGSRTLKDAIFRKFMINELVYHGEIPLIILPQ